MKELILADFGKWNSVNIASLTISEVWDIILGQEIAAPFVQWRQMAELEKSTDAQSQVAAVQTQGRQLTSTMYEQQQFSSKCDWWVRIISATYLPLRLQPIYVSNDDVKDDAASYTYVLPKKILRAFITASDLRNQVAAFLYGVSPLDNNQAKEIKAMAWAPQQGSNNSVELPARLPKDDLLPKDLEPLGWIKMQALEINHLSPMDVKTQAKLMDHPEFCFALAFGCWKLWAPNLSYSMTLDMPLLFWAEEHWPAACLTFADLEQGDDSVDVENSFA
ncbi:hypothetical protein K438DRAFT_1997093 [Mycena galopus ATCC 62051]|nr:hypothetical protein K438DRAFT_1997093 [Mycena galopus ATCC 62051]